MYMSRKKGTNLGFLAAGPSSEAGPLLMLKLDLDFGPGEEVLSMCADASVNS